MGILEPGRYGDHFHELFVSSLNKKIAADKGIRARKKKDNQQQEQLYLSSAFSALRMELQQNASKFAVFSSIRSAVLEAETKYSLIHGGNPKKSIIYPCCGHCVTACKSGGIVDCRCHSQRIDSKYAFVDNDSDDSDDSDDTTQRETMQKVPQIVGAGLKSLFELIAEARNVHPSLCTKALKALFDVVQGQYPESFKSEPNDMINQLYDLLLDLATLHGPASPDRNEANNWSAIGCSTLLGLCVARGDTGKSLKALTAMLMSPKILSTQNIQLPIVLSTLQRSVISVALDKPIKPNFLKNGIPKNCLIDHFSLRNQLPANIQFTLQPSIASDGRYLYILISKTLLKIGSGFNGTLKGYVYGVNNEFGKEKTGWIGYANNTLYYKRISKRSNDNVLIVDTETLSITGATQATIPPIRDGQNSILFSDGETLNAICTAKDDSLVVKQVLTTGQTIFDLPLKLARKTFRTLGYAVFEDEVLNQNQIQKIQSSFNPFEPKLINEIDVLNIVCGKEFGLVRTPNGKVFFYGKATSLGLKSVGKSPMLRLTELIVSKVANIVQIAIGHDGIHALLVNDDGSVYFTGSARRGEDGDSSKNRRQPKPVKPKKISKIESHFIVHVSCNNGTSAFVTKTGKLIMFGKDTTHCDTSGFVTDLLDQHITKVSLGKAHCVALNSKGQLFTFGLNNKGQCGRQFVKDKEAASSVMETSDAKANETKVKFDMSNMCDPEDHSVVLGQCRICSVCKECTGYNISCVSTLHLAIDERNPGSNCACGHGCAGCSKCGACSTCISYQESENINDPNKDGLNYSELLGRQRSKSLILRKNDKKQVEDGNQGSDIERDQPRVAPLPPQKVSLPSSSPVVQISCGLHHTVVLTLSGEVFTFGSNQYGQLGTGDLQSSSGPVQVKVPGMISQVAAGANHTVLLTFKGVVFTFGNYQKGQLGRLPNDFQSNDDLINSININKQDLNSEPQNAADILLQRQKFLWNCTAGAVFGIGPNYGKRATWIGASGDQTFIKIDESLVTGSMLSKVNVVADKNTIILIPNIPISFNCLAINRRDGTCSAYNTNQVDFIKLIQSNQTAISQITSDKCNQNIDTNPLTSPQEGTKQMSQSIHEARNQVFDLQKNMQRSDSRGSVGRQQRTTQKTSEKVHPQLAFTLESNYGNLWVFDAIAKNIYCYNVVASEMVNNSSDLRAILSPALALPSKSEIQITRNQASLNLLACLDILTTSSDSIPGCFETEAPQCVNPSKETQCEDYQTINRFENFGGGWGYSGHSVEAIRFMADTEIIIGGFGVFGGRGEYTCKLKLFDLGPDGGGYEKDGVLLSETEEIPYECPARSKHNIMLPKPITANAGRWHLVWARISGPSSDCGSSGQSTVTTEDQVVFTFKSTKKANNGTDVNSGQIPSILYQVVNHESKQSATPVDLDPVHKISKLFANTVTKECFESLVTLLKWSWGTFKITLIELKDKKKYPQTKSSLDRLVYINKACLRLLRKYTNEIYPNNSLTKGEKNTTRQNAFNDSENKKKSPNQLFPVNQVSSTSKIAVSTKLFTINNSMESNTPTNTKRTNSENIQLAECIGDVRALLMQVLCDDISLDIDTEASDMLIDILDECHTTYVSCFNAFYPTSTLKWNSLCDLLVQMDKGILHSRLLSAILAGLCSPTVKLRSTFSLLTPNIETKSIVSPSDNAGLPMLSTSETYQYPILVEQMIHRTRQERNDFLIHFWSFKDVLIKLLNIVSYPIKTKIENIYHNRSGNHLNNDFKKKNNQGLIDNCCHLLARVLAEIVYQTCSFDLDVTLLPSKSLQTTGSRFARCDVSRTWNTGNFGPDAIAFTVDRAGIAIAGATIYSGSGNYEYQLELLYDQSMDSKSQSHHRWETLESISGTYDQDIVQNDMADIKFDRPVQIKEHGKYAIRLCSQGARTCSGDAGVTTLRGPCGVNFTFYPCDLSFNGTTTIRGQIPCILYYSSPVQSETNTGKLYTEINARDTALQIASDITKKCAELLVLARNTIAASVSPSDKSPNSSNNTQTIDSEHNITPIEEHLDINWTNNSNHTNTSTSVSEYNLSTARDLTKKLESFSKGIIETLKFEKKSTNPFEFEIEIGATEITPKDLMQENEINDRMSKNGKFSKNNGNNRIISNNDDIRNYLNEVGKSDSEDDSLTQVSCVQILELFGLKDASMFHTLLPLVFAHIGPLVNSDPKSSVQILSLIREILPHVAALNQLHMSKEIIAEQKMENKENIDVKNKNLDDGDNNLVDMCTTSNHYCTIESEHPYKGASICTYRVEFPPCVQWFSIEFDPQSGTAQPEDYLLVSIPSKPKVKPNFYKMQNYDNEDDDTDTNNLQKDVGVCKNINIITSYCSLNDDNAVNVSQQHDNDDWIVAKKFNTPSQWTQNEIILPGNKVELSLETASNYLRDQQSNHYGFKCLIIGYDNPSLMKFSNSCLIRLEYELAYLGGMCSANLMKKDLILPDDKSENLSSIEETMGVHSALLGKGLALPDSMLTIDQALESHLPIGSQSNERQFLKDFVTGAPGSSGARLAAWLQPEPRLDTNKCELKPIQEPVRYGWPTQLTVLIRDQYGDDVLVPDLKVEINAIPAEALINGGRKMRRVSQTDPLTFGGLPPPAKIPYEPIIKEKMCFKAITFMKPYQQYSFEELRFCSPTQTRVAEKLYAQDMEDGSFRVSWTPNSVGSFCITVSIDGIALEEIYRIEVKEAGIPPPPQKMPIKKTQPANKLRKFIATNSAGLRIRSHPTLQSEQVGIVKMNGIISFIDEIENDDGVWVRLSTESIRQHCTSAWYPTEAWCLQYNQHIGKTLLHPLIEPQSSKTILERIRKNSHNSTEPTDDEAVTEPQPKLKVGSPSKKGFDFPTSKFTPPLTTESTQPSSNPFIFQSKTSPKHCKKDPQLDDQQQQQQLASSSDSGFDIKQPKINDSLNPFLSLDPKKSSDVEKKSEEKEPIDNDGPLTSKDIEPRRSMQHQMSQSPSNLSQSSSNLSQSPNQSNIGSTIAVVVGGGASKLQALQKWFKGDSFDGKENFGKKKSDLSEFASVSVRDLVKAIGGQDAKSNGNDTTPSHLSRSSSPVAIPGSKYRELHSGHSSSSKSVEVSDTSALVSSLTRDLSQSPSQASIKEETVESPKIVLFPDSTKTSQSQSDFGTTVRSGNFSLGSNIVPTSSSNFGRHDGSPKHGPRKLRSKRSISPGMSQYTNKDIHTEKDATSTANTGNLFDTKNSLLSGDKAISSFWSSSASVSASRAATNLFVQTNVTSENLIESTENLDNKKVSPKRALPPALAESLRAVFAAFLWHEGIVHDAMACASFLKFHPNLPKQGGLVVTRGDNNDTKTTLTKEQKAQQRHSVEVANAGNYLNIRPSTLETLTKSGNSSIYNRRRGLNNGANGVGNSEKSKLQALPEIVTVLPPALRCLVYLWEQLCSNCVQLVQSNAMEMEIKNTPPMRPPRNKPEPYENASDRDSRKARKKKKDEGHYCELCEIFLPIPVTCHMRVVHPGCGKPAKGKGYNSVGTLCEGWAGNCGEGGKGAASWYLICDKCREKFMSRQKNINNLNAPNATNLNSPSTSNTTTTTIPKIDNLFGLKTSLIINSDIYTMMKDNALFLLELSSNNSGGLSTNHKKSPQQMPVVTETQLSQFALDPNKPGTSRGDNGTTSARSSYIQKNNRHSGTKGILKDSMATQNNFNGRVNDKNNQYYGNIPSAMYQRKASGPHPSCISPELMWPAPEVFSCLESLGASVSTDLPYEIFGLNSAENGFDRPLSEISFDSIDPNATDPMTTSGNHPNSSISRFHRSLSMGQGWATHQNGSKYYVAQNVDNVGPDQGSRVVLRRRNNSSCDSDIGSLLLCYPSTNLRKLVPEAILNPSCVVENTTTTEMQQQNEQLNQKSNLNDAEDSDQSTVVSKVDELKFPDFIRPTTRVDSLENPDTLKNTEDHDKSLRNDKTDIEANTVCLLSRPTITFILQQHDLDKLKYAMKRSLRVATCRIYSLQALNWLMRTVTQTICLHDLMWWFVTSLTPTLSSADEKLDEMEQALEHPVSSTQMSGRVSSILSQSLHSLLQSIADLTLLLPAGSSLQQIAIHCFGIRFRQADHQFLHRSHVFGNISKILSKSDEQNEDMILSSTLAMQESNSNILGQHNSLLQNCGAKISSLVDLNGMFELTVSSRQAMAAALTDNSTETFWESDEEDRNKSKIIEISMNKLNYVCKQIFVHIDNSRDIANKVQNIMFYAGQSLGDTNLIKSVDIDSTVKAGCWISANIKDESSTHFRIVFTGQEPTLRIRSIRLMGYPVLEDKFIALKQNLKITNAIQIQQRNCEAETLRVFRLITAQVFGKFILGQDQDNINLAAPVMESSATSLLADSLDMREHMVGILFSRSKLSHLQKQVIVHIVHAIRKETQRAKEEWEILNTTAVNLQGNFDQKSDSSSEPSRAPDTYCFEMLSMVLALSGSTVGRSYLSHQYGLLKDLLSLLHTGSDRVQRQVTALLRRMLPEISPESLGDLLGVVKMPPTDFSIADQSSDDFDMKRLGIIDIFLAVIAKSLQLQVKVKSNTTGGPNKNPPIMKLSHCIDFNIHNLKDTKLLLDNNKENLQLTKDANDFEFLYDWEVKSQYSPSDIDGACKKSDYDFEIKKKPKGVRNLNQRWFLKGMISTKHAENIISLIRDMASGELTERWSLVTKAAIAESILNLTRLDDVFRNPDNCIKTATLWLALASLCVLDKDHVERLSSGQWSKNTSETRPLCSNHDDGVTPAVIQCDSCGSLCSECDRFLHLNRRTRSHHRTVCKEEEEAIRVELHESCGRIKLFWLLALADYKTLKAMIEFRDGNNSIISGPPNSVGRCRFCGLTGNSGLLAVGNVCADAQCQEYAAVACAKIRPCGHVCGGVADEPKCLPCLQHVCHSKENETAENLKSPKLTQDADDMCMICFTEALSCAPSIQLECGHVFHFHCCKAVLLKRWTGPRISFGFSQCPICKGDINHALLTELLEPIITLKNDVKRKAVMRMEYEGIMKTTDHKDLASYAMDRYAYYVCYKCQKAYFGGEARCNAEMGDNYDPQELVCGACSDVAKAQMCPKHGTDFLEYKCRFCCSVAVFFCFGTTHFCDTCHDDFQRLTNIPKNKLPRCPAGPKAKQLLGEECPLHVIHPSTGEEFALGCGICRQAHTF